MVKIFVSHSAVEIRFRTPLAILPLMKGGGPELDVLALEVTPGLLAGAEPNTHQFYVTICL
jgi:hypothetical protein